MVPGNESEQSCVQLNLPYRHQKELTKTTAVVRPGELLRWNYRHLGLRTGNCTQYKCLTCVSNRELSQGCLHTSRTVVDRTEMPNLVGHLRECKVLRRRDLYGAA